MTEKLSFDFFRNPVWITCTFVAIVLPDFLVACQFDFLKPYATLSEEDLTCPNVLISEVFVGRSILSFFMVVIIFESLRFLQRPLRLNLISRGWQGLMRFELKTLTGLSFGLLSYIMAATLLNLMIQTQEGEPTLAIQTRELIWAVTIVFVLINGHLIYMQLRSKSTIRNSFISCEGPFGNVQLDISQVDWFEKSGRQYYAKSGEKQFKVSLTLKELEKKLNSDEFVRINRSVLMNCRMIAEYTHWENEKYILKTLNKEEFVVSRNRIKEIKKLMSQGIG